MAGNCCNDTSSCNGYVYSSSCVVWNSDDLTYLNITKGDTLDYIISNIDTKLESISKGKGITVDSLDATKCKAIGDRLTDKSLSNILQVLVDYQCTLKTYIDEKTATDPVVYDVKCLVPANNKESSIIQALINKTCTNTESINNINTQVKTNTTDIKNLKRQVSSILGEDNSAPVFTFSQLLPPWVPQPYIGSLDNFDASGKGKSDKGFDNVYIMNGQNGTDDWRGYTPVGANSGVPGGSLDPRVDPATYGSFKLSPGQKTGEVSHSLTTTEMPSHSHSINDPGHSHTYNSLSVAGHPKGSDQNNLRWQITDRTSTEKTGITINNAGGGRPHNNIQPSVACIWIVKLP